MIANSTSNTGGGWPAASLLLSVVSPAFASAMHYLGVGLHSNLAVYVYAAGVDMLAAVALTLFCGRHVWLALRNTTTLEPRNFEYDLGWKANVEQLFGRRRLAWLIPLLAEGTGDGIHWARSADHQA
uniref:Protein S-acyltransferase n=2 Tax=Haptolina ericina TaxID=156174 RepID=A0A7S3BKZ6_9EUKA